MGNFKLQLKYDLNLAKCGEIAERMKDFRIPFGEIISNWAKGNVAKFNAGRGAETTGAIGKALTPAAWKPVTPEYYRQKHGPVKRGDRQTFADWLMVRTGELRDVLTERGGFGELITTNRVVFGTPMDSADADKALYNSERRPTVFLNESDRLGIRAELQNYITFGGNYKNFLKSRAALWVQRKQKNAEWDVNIAEGGQ